ncbi:hypothetical protein BDZ89DRAFT_1144544 [Hymenopellis radicata]|nr:hypothetical protein BDZ89DRAFT_1144544 [Hymenopellis radicata]
MDPFLFTTIDGKVRNLQRYEYDGTAFTGYLGSRNEVPIDVMSTVDFLDLLPSPQFFDNSAEYVGLFTPAKWDTTRHWRGWIPITFDAGQSNGPWITRLTQPALADDEGDPEEFRLDRDLAALGKQEGGKWSRVLEVLKRSIGCPENAPFPDSYVYDELDRTFPTQHGLNLSHFRLKCHLLEVLGYIVWFRTLPGWDKNIASDIIAMVEAVADQVDHVRGFIIDIARDYASINMDLWTRCDVSILVHNIPHEASPEVAAKFDIDLYEEVRAYQNIQGSLDGFEPPASLVRQWFLVQQLDLLLRPRVKVPFPRNLRDAEFIEPGAYVYAIEAPGWKPITLSRYYWMALKYWFDYRVLPKRTGIEDANPGRQQVEFLTWRWLGNWREEVDSRQDRRMIQKAIDRMNEFQPYPSNRLAREVFRWTNAPSPGQMYGVGDWIAADTTRQLSLPIHMFDMTPRYLRRSHQGDSYSTNTMLSNLAGIQQLGTAASVTRGMSLAERMSVITPPLLAKRKGKDVAEGEQSKRFRQDQTLMDRLSDSSTSIQEAEEPSEDEREEEPESAPIHNAPGGRDVSPDFSHVSEEEYLDARSVKDDYKPVTLDEFIPQGQRSLSLNYGPAPYNVPAGFVLSNEYVHWAPASEEVDPEDWVRVPLSARAVAFESQVL